MRGFRVFLLIGAVTMCAQTPQRNYLNEGIAALKSAKYSEAAQLFQQAVNVSPADVQAHLYLASVNMAQFIPGAGTAENAQYWNNAEREFQAVLALEPGNIVALESLASLHFNSAQSGRDASEKMRALDNATYWYQKILSVEPANKIAYYSLGVIAWSKFYPDLIQARLILGMRPDTPGPLPNAATRAELRARHGRTVADGIQSLDRAIAIDAKYDDALAYLNLLYRERADLAETPEAYRQDVQMADSLVQRALEVKRQKATQQYREGQNRPSSAGFVIRPGILGAPPPPPPPPPPASPGSPAGVQSEPAAAMPRQIRVDSAVQSAKLVESPQPQYPPLAFEARIQGRVRFQVTIAEDGSVENLTLISGHPLMVPAATEAARRYRYQTTTLNGTPVKVISELEVNFNLQ